MKKILVVLYLLMLSGCFTAGNFSAKREYMHNIGSDESICEEKPERCIEGIPW